MARPLRKIAFVEALRKIPKKIPPKIVATKVGGGGGKALVAGALKKRSFIIGGVPFSVVIL